MKRYARVDKAGDMACDSNFIARELIPSVEDSKLDNMLAKKVNLVAHNMCKLDNRIRRHLE
jgi:hypothetical protein